MVHVPAQLKLITAAKLKALSKGDQGAIQSFAKTCVDASTKSLKDRTPSDSQYRDTWNDGYLHGLIAAHELYQNLAEYAESEIKNREEEATKQATKKKI